LTAFLSRGRPAASLEGRPMMAKKSKKKDKGKKKDKKKK
jgi:hypothetical protein